MSGVQITRLGSGLTVATDPMDGVESATVGAWVGVGTRHERAEVNGVAHLVEHMMFKGTARRSAFLISEQIEDVGGHLNAYTTREHTAYFAKVLGDDVPLAIDLIADMLQNSLLEEQELSREREVVIQEIGQALDTPDDIVFDYFQSTAYPGQALGRPVLGSAETVADLPRQSLVDYLGRHYGGPGIVLAAAGRVNHDRILDLADRVFGGLASAADLATEGAQYAGGDFREDRDLEQAHLILGFEGVGVHHPDFYAHAVLSTLLGGGMSSRLFREVREKRGLVYSIYTFTGSYKDGGLFGVYAGTSPDRVGELVPILCGELTSVADTLSVEEVRRARSQLKAGTLMALESTMSRCEHLGQQLLIYGRQIPTPEVVQRIEAVDMESVLRCARQLLNSRPTVAALGPLDQLESYDRIAARLS